MPTHDRNHALAMAGSYLNPRFKLGKVPSLNPLVSSNLGSRSKLPDDQHQKSIKFEPLKDFGPAQNSSSRLTAPLKEIINERKVFLNKNLFQDKPPQSNSPPPKSTKSLIMDSKRVGILEQRVESSLLDQDQLSLRNRKLREPNELKTMDHVIGQIKKQSQENKMSNLLLKVNSEYFSTEKLKAKKKNSGHISVHLNNAIAEAQGDFRKAEPLNDAIFKKLGLDPATKEQQETHLAANVEQEGFLNKIRLRKRINPPMTSPREKILRSNNLTLPLRSGSADLPEMQMNLEKKPSLPMLSRGKESLKTRGISQLYRNDLKAFGGENLSPIDPNFKIVEVDEYNKTDRTLSISEFDVKDGRGFAQIETMLSNRCSQETKADEGAALTSSGSKEENTLQQSSKALITESEVFELKQIIIRANQLLKEDRIKQQVLEQDNQRLIKEVAELKFKLKTYEGIDI